MYAELSTEIWFVKQMLNKWLYYQTIGIRNLSSGMHRRFRRVRSIAWHALRRLSERKDELHSICNKEMEAPMNEEFKEMLKAEGLDTLENCTRDVVEHAFKIIIAALKVAKADYLKAMVPMMEIMQDYVLKLVDKIDGEEG